MPFVLFLLALGGFGALALKAGQAKTEAERGHDPLGDRQADDPQIVPQGAGQVQGAPVPQYCGIGCYEVALGGVVVGLADLGQCVQIGRLHPTARFRRIG